MNSIIQNFEKEQIVKHTSKKSIPAFRAGDTLKVTVKITEGDRTRLQAFEGVCIARKNNSINSKFTVRKISHGEGVERVFPLFSPIIDKIEVIRKGDVKRAKLYYLRKRTGKSARISDLDRGEEADEYSISEDPNKNLDANEEVVEEAKEIDPQNQEKKMEEEMPSQLDKEIEKTDELISEKKSESAASEAVETENESKS